MAVTEAGLMYVLSVDSLNLSFLIYKTQGSLS